MGVQTSAVFGLTMEGIPYLNEDGSTDVVDMELAEVALRNFDATNTAARYGAGGALREPVGSQNQASAQIRTNLIQEILMSEGLGQADGVNAEALPEVLLEMFG